MMKYFLFAAILLAAPLSVSSAFAQVGADVSVGNAAAAHVEASTDTVHTDADGNTVINHDAIVKSEVNPIPDEDSEDDATAGSSAHLSTESTTTVIPAKK